MRRLLLLFVFASFLATPAFAAPGSAPVPVKKVKAKTGIEWHVSPDVAIVFLNGKKLGTAGNLKFTKARPGRHTIRLTKGGDEAELEVKVTKGQVLQVNYSFSE